MTLLKVPMTIPPLVIRLSNTKEAQAQYHLVKKQRLLSAVFFAAGNNLS